MSDGCWEDDGSEQNFLGISLRVRYGYILIIFQRYYVRFGVEIGDSVDINVVLEGKRILAHDGTW